MYTHMQTPSAFAKRSKRDDVQRIGSRQDRVASLLQALTLTGKLSLPAALLASRAPFRPNWLLMPSTRWVELMFLTRVIW
jgi:hypothetical protein